jgi:ribosomal protein L11 methyltransferase
MSWCALDVRSPAGERDAVAAWLVGRTGHAVEERADGTLISVVESAGAADRLLLDLHAAFGRDVAAAARTLPDIDWRLRWRDGLAPRRLGRLVIAPSWCELPDSDAVVLRIDPETAFGTAEHGSTRGALLLLDRLITPGMRVLDLGSGSGILGIAAARLGAASAIGLDLDPEAEPIARGNAERNGVADRTRFLTGDALLLTPLLGPVDLVLSNILRAQNQQLLPMVRAILAPGGRAIFAGMETTEQTLFRAVLGHEGFVPIGGTVDEGWWTVAAEAG